MSESESEEAVYCETCEMWLNGRTQWEDHEIGKTRKKKAEPSRVKERPQSKVEHLPAHPWLMEAMVVSTSQATARIDDVRHNLPVGSTEAAERCRHKQIKTRRRMRQRSNSMKTRLAMLRISDEATVFEKRCSQCKRTILKNRWCSGCYSESYCSRECQRLHWPYHKKDCKTLYGLIGEQECGTLYDISESQSEDAPQPESVSVVDTSFSIVLPVREEHCSDSEWTLVSDSETEPEELV